MIAVGGCHARAKPVSRDPASEWQTQLAEVAAGQRDRIEIAAEAIDDEKFAQLAPIGGTLKKLSLGQAKLSIDSLAKLRQMPQLEELVLKGLAIDDEGLKAIAAVASLKRVNVPQADSSDDGLAALAALPELELLRIGGPRLTGAGLTAFEMHSRLRFLHLIDAPIEDAALDSVAKIETLESFYVDGGRVGDEAWERFFRARPGLHVHLGAGHHDADPKKHDHSH